MSLSTVCLNHIAKPKLTLAKEAAARHSVYCLSHVSLSHSWAISINIEACLSIAFLGYLFTSCFASIAPIICGVIVPIIWGMIVPIIWGEFHISHPKNPPSSAH